LEVAPALNASDNRRRERELIAPLSTGTPRILLPALVRVQCPVLGTPGVKVNQALIRPQHITLTGEHMLAGFASRVSDLPFANRRHLRPRLTAPFPLCYFERSGNPYVERPTNFS